MEKKKFKNRTLTYTTIHRSPIKGLPINTILPLIKLQRKREIKREREIEGEKEIEREIQNETKLYKDKLYYQETMKI